MNNARKFSIADGMEQGKRFPAALAADFFRPEERGFEALLAMSLDLAGQLAFIDPDNRQRGTWGDLFESNEAAVMAHILSMDTARLEAEYIARSALGLEHGVRFVHSVLRTIDFWFTALGRSGNQASVELSERLEALLADDLARHFLAFRQLVAQLVQAGASLDDLDFEDYHRFREGKPIVADLQASVDGTSGATSEGLSRIFSSLRSIIARLRSLVTPYLAESLQSKRHEPAIALFMVFLRLLGRANSSLNQFSRRHLDFYYREVLGAEERRQQAERVFLSLQLAEGQDPVRVPAGTRFIARAEADGGEATFISERDTGITAAKVDSLYTLRFERDRYISPEIGLGYVTRIKALRRDTDGADAGSDWPLFGTSSRLAGFKRAQDARIGFAVTSPVLLLGEGQRSIEVRVEFATPEASREAQGSERLRQELQALLEQPQADAETFHGLLGRIFRHCVLVADEDMSDAFRKELVRAARRLASADVREMIKHYLRLGPEAIVQQLLKDVFRISLTVPGGWYQVDRFVLTRFPSTGSSVRGGLCFQLTLGPEVEPVVVCSPQVHGLEWDCSSPAIRFQLNPEAAFCAYSLFTELPLDSISIDVHVAGVRGLKMYNNLGRIDPTRPFQPFGPLPTRSSYLAFGSFEMAQKQLTGLKLNLEWADLPTCFSGFASHYAGYDRVVREEDFQVDMAVLQDGVWQPGERDRQAGAASLFQATGASERLKPSRTIGIGILDFFRPIDATIGADQFDLQTGTRNGFFRVRLSGPEGSFGHAEYPALLSRALSENIRSKKPFQSVPNPPYTPMLSQLSVDYSARADISVDEIRPATSSDRDQRILHLHPFGHEEVRPVHVGRTHSLLPGYELDGNLFIGLGGCSIGQAVTLFFHLNEETNQQTTFPPPSVSWQYLGSGGWQPLQATQIVLDTTNRFRRSGSVTLMLPDDMQTHSSLMPDGKAWIRVAANEHLDSVARLYTVHANVVCACAGPEENARSEATAGRIPVERTWRMAEPLRGIANVSQVGGSGPGRPGEDRRRFVTRMSERLRHKNRAVSAQDFEQLILERFPNVFKVKCFDGLTAAGFNPEGAKPSPRAGHIMIVAVADAGEGEDLEYRRPMLDVQQLQDIREFARGIAAPFIRIEVRNPLYERLQVRCKVKFTGEENPGFHLRRLNRDVSGFVCPWMPYGYQASFGWSISCEEVEGFIRGRDYVELVTDFSMLHIAEDDDDLYTLADTVSRNPAPGQGNSKRVRWRYPWSLAVPMERHFIESVQVSEPVAPEPAGVGELDIGGTFIIGGT